MLRFYLIEWTDVNQDEHRTVVCARNRRDAEGIWEFHLPDGSIDTDHGWSVESLPRRRGHVRDL